MIGQAGPGRIYPGDTCYHENDKGRRDCKEPRCETSKGRSTFCIAHEKERNRECKRAYRARKNGVAPAMETERGGVWDIEKGKPAGMCITPGCRADIYQNASRCKSCIREQRLTPRVRPQNAIQLGPDEENLPRRVSSKPPVLPYSFRAFTWKGTLSEELRNGR